MINVIRGVVPEELTSALENVYSQYGEDGLLKEVFRRIGTTNKQCFEVGAADGKWFSNSRRLIDEGWSACLIEADEKNWPELDKLDNTDLWDERLSPGGPPDCGRVTVVHGKAEATGPNSLDNVLDKCDFDECPDLGIIDVDGQDYFMWLGLIRHRPRVVVIEYDPLADNAFIPERNGVGQAGRDALFSIAASRGYFNVAVTPTNLIFAINNDRDKFYAEPKAKAILAPPPASLVRWAKSIDETPAVKPAEVPKFATGKEQEIKIVAVLSRPRFGLNVFWDCASEALAPWHIPIRSFYCVFWEMGMQKAMEEALDEGIDWVLTLDYDSLFNSRHVQQLIDVLGQNPNVDAVAALQARRGRPLPLMVRSDGEYDLSGGPIQVRTAHFGLTLFRVEALRKMKKPWFWSTPTPTGSWGEGRLDPDIYFWGNWGDSGNSLFVHTGCKIGHVEEMVAHYDGTEVKHSYITEWRQKHGHKIKSFE